MRLGRPAVPRRLSSGARGVSRSRSIEAGAACAWAAWHTATAAGAACCQGIMRAAKAVRLIILTAPPRTRVLRWVVSGWVRAHACALGWLPRRLQRT